MTKSVRNRILAIILLPAFIWLMYNNAANWHLHQLSSGWIVSHAHPFDSSTDSNGTAPCHKHSATQLLILNEISSLLIQAIVVVAVFVFFREGQAQRFLLQVRVQIIRNYLPIPLLRGPPRLCY